MQLLIAGGGLAGLATALALARRGIASHVVEKNPQFAELGAGLQLAPNATRRLRALDVLEAASSDAVAPRQLVLADALEGRQIMRLDLGPAFLERFGAPYLLMHRGDLLNALYEACRDSGLVVLEAGREVASVEERGRRAAACFTDGSEIEADVLLGADGVSGVVRPCVHDDPLGRDGFVAYRSGAVPIEEVTHAGQLDSMVMWVGPDLHFVQYPLRRGELYNQVAVFKSPTATPEHDDWGGPAELDEAYARVCPAIQAAMPLMRRDRWWTMVDREPMSTWHRGRLILTGDAAHPMYQYAAQGACQSIEDTAAFARHIAARPDDPDAALAAFEAERAPRAARVQTTARRWGDICHIDGVGRHMRNALLRRIAPDDYTYVEWLYGQAVA